MTLADLLDPKLLIMAVNALATALLWLRKPGQDASQAVDHLKGRVDVLEERMKHMPSTDELQELKGTVMAVQATLNGQVENLVVVRNTTARIEDWIRTLSVPNK